MAPFRINADLEKFRRDAKMSTLELSDKTGIARTSLRRKMKNPGQFTIDELAAVAAVLDIPEDAFKAAS